MKINIPCNFQVEPNPSLWQRRALTKLCKNTDSVISKADKGSIVLIQNRSDYICSVKPWLIPTIPQLTNYLLGTLPNTCVIKFIISYMIITRNAISQKTFIHFAYHPNTPDSPESIFLKRSIGHSPHCLLMQKSKYQPIHWLLAPTTH